LKRISRKSEKFAIIDLIKSIGREQGFALGDVATEKHFTKRISELFNQEKSNPLTLHGCRIESMFGYVAGSLGKCILIKQEDAGEIYALHPDIKPPDYRLILENNAEFFVEVKNCHKRAPSSCCSFKKSYIEELLKYVRLFNLDLKIAIYWSRWNIWTLVPVNKLPVRKEKYSINMLEAAKVNEMYILGDVMVGTIAPLTLKTFTDPKKPRSIDKTGMTKFTIGGVEIYCAEKLIKDKHEQKIAFYLMLFGDWIMEERQVNVISNELVDIKLSLLPEEPVPGQGFDIIGSLSGMISRQYNTLTTSERDVKLLSPSAEPGSLGVVIPPDYKGKYLPIWRLIVEP
jgi:hypothetical protein